MNTFNNYKHAIVLTTGQVAQHLITSTTGFPLHTVGWDILPSHNKSSEYQMPMFHSPRGRRDDHTAETILLAKAFLRKKH